MKNTALLGLSIILVAGCSSASKGTRELSVLTRNYQPRSPATSERICDATLSINKARPQSLQKMDSVLGTGAVVAAGTTVHTNFRGWVWVNDPGTGYKGIQFEDHTDREPFTFDVGSHQVIAGLEQGIMGMKAGGKRSLVIPANLAFGQRQIEAISICPGDAIILEVEILRVD